MVQLAFEGFYAFHPKQLLIHCLTLSNHYLLLIIVNELIHPTTQWRIVEVAQQLLRQP